MSYATPRLPVLNWNTFSGRQKSSTPCLLNHPNTRFTTSGRASILLALEVLGVGPGDKVLVPTYHCPTMVAPVISLGATAVFYPLSGNGAPQMDWLQNLDTGSFKAILVAHFFGLPQRMAPIRNWCNSHGIAMIEDCAHALFGAADGRPLGQWGDLAIASLTKFYPVPEGGCLVNNSTQKKPAPMTFISTGVVNQVKGAFDIVHNSVDHGRLVGLQTLMQGLLRLQRWGRGKPPTDAPLTSAQPVDDAGETFRIDTARSRVRLNLPSRWLAQFSSRQRIVDQRRAHFKYLAQALGNLKGMRPLHPQLPPDCAPYVFPLWVNEPDPGYARLRELRFPVSRWDRLWPNVPRIEGDSGVQWSHHILQIACHQDLSIQELKTMVATLKAVYEVAS